MAWQPQGTLAGSSPQTVTGWTEGVVLTTSTSNPPAGTPPTTITFVL